MDQWIRKWRSKDWCSLSVRKFDSQWIHFHVCVRSKISSMDGQGNFNWRFVYNFFYFPAERVVSIQKKEHFWSYDTTELQIPPILNLQIWDNDKFSPDDFLGNWISKKSIKKKKKTDWILGALTLDLNRLYKPAKDADVCTLENLNNQTENCVSIFEVKRLKGWWPCVDLQSGNPELTVKRNVFEFQKSKIYF